MALVKAKVLNAVVYGCVKDSVIEIEETQANYLADIGYVELVDPATPINRIEQEDNGANPLCELKGKLSEASKERMTYTPYVHRRRFK